MTLPTSKCSILMVSKSPGQMHSVAQRIEQRLTVLNAWLSDGIPIGKKIPRSLNAARRWEDDDLGIKAILSPNEFTTTHTEHGQSVKKIQDLISSLARRYAKPNKSLSKASKDPAIDHSACARALAGVVSQWHTERDQRLVEQARAKAATARSNALLEENAEKDRLIADLLRQLNTKSGLRIVE